MGVSLTRHFQDKLKEVGAKFVQGNVADLVEAGGIRSTVIQFGPYTVPTMWAWPNPRRQVYAMVPLQRVSEEIYVSLMHELGHIADNLPTLADYGSAGTKTQLVSEAWAWEWAIRNAIKWTEVSHIIMLKSFDTYVDYFKLCHRWERAKGGNAFGFADGLEKKLSDLSNKRLTDGRRAIKLTPWQVER